MNHFEVCCQICGVSFNIGRYPTKSEITTGMRNAQWLHNTRLPHAQVVGFCKEDCFVATLPDTTAGPEHDDPHRHQIQAESIKPFQWGVRSAPHEQHVSGSQCRKLGGYNGNVISPEEIKGCCTSQCLIPKPRNPATLLPRDELLGNQEQFEVDGDFYLSGLADSMPSEGLLDSIHPPPNEPVIAKNCFWNIQDAETVAMPFHPTCLEVYKRASLQRFGIIDMQGLTDWYCLEADPDVYFHTFPRHRRVKAAQKYWTRVDNQIWFHHPTSEWLAANPCFVPALPSVLSSAVRSDEPPVGHTLEGNPSTGRSVQSDFFWRLPIEIRLNIAELLDARDFSCARLVSRAFHDLPQSFYKGFIVRNYPWLWEVWCDIPFAFWAGNESWELKEKDDKWMATKSDLEDSIDVIRSCSTSNEENTEDQLNQIKEIELLIAAESAEHKKTRDPIPAYSLLGKIDDVDWYRLYCNLSKDPMQLKGLKNRKRVWRQCSSILNRIERYRAANFMGPNARRRPFDSRRKTARAYRRRLEIRSSRQTREQN